MYINVSLQAVRATEATVSAAKAMLVANHTAFSADMQQALGEWNDANVIKFIQLFGEMSGSLNDLLIRLGSIEEFCHEVERMIILYNE